SDPDVTFTGGEEVELRLSSLSFTSDEPKVEEVQLLVDGEQTDTFPVDNTVTPSADETGVADVSFTMPDLSEYDEGETITFELVFGATSDSQQSIPFTLEVTGGGTTPGGDGPDDNGSGADNGAGDDDGSGDDDDAGSGDDDGAGSGDDGSDEGSGDDGLGRLPDTGAEVALAAAVAGALVLLGTVGVILGRRRRNVTG